MKGEICEDSKQQNFKSIKRMQKAWKWGTNKYVCPHSVTILWCLSYEQPNAEVNEPHIVALENLSGLWKLGYPTLVDYNQY